MAHAEGKIHKGHENVRKHHRGHPRGTAPTRFGIAGEGIDVSEVQGSVDFKAVHEQGHKHVVIAKSTEGATYRDKMWTKQRATEMNQFIPRPAIYHFCRPENNSPQAEVDNLARAIHDVGIKIVASDAWLKGTKKGWRVFADFETPPFSPQWLEGFAKAFHKEFSHRPDLYGYGASLSPVQGVFNDFAMIDFAAYVADWHPFYHGPVGKVKFWQFSATGRCPGVNGAVDLDRYLG